MNYYLYSLRLFWQRRKYFSLLLVAYCLVIYGYFRLLFSDVSLIPLKLNLNYGDCLWLVFGGQFRPEIMAPSMSKLAVTQFFWIVLCFLISLAILGFGTQQLYGSGLQLFMRLNKRVTFILGHLLSVATVILLIYGVLLLGIWLVALSCGFANSLAVNQDYLSLMFDVLRLKSASYFIAPTLADLLVNYVVLVALAFFQSVIEIVSKPLFGFLLNLATVFVALGLSVPLLLPQYLMWLRSDLLGSEGANQVNNLLQALPAWLRLIVASLYLLVTVLCLALYLKRCDFLNKEGRF